MYGRYGQGLASTIERRLLLPLDTNALAEAQSRQAPLHNLEPRALLEKLMAEYVFALLTGAAIDRWPAKMPRASRRWRRRMTTSPKSFRNCAKAPARRAKPKSPKNCLI